MCPWRKNNETPKFVASKRREYSTDFSGTDDLSVEGKHGSGTGTELEVFNFSRVAAATNNFSDENKLGQGGFGPVYKVMFFIFFGKIIRRLNIYLYCI